LKRNKGDGRRRTERRIIAEKRWRPDKKMISEENFGAWKKVD
jgi:hypothetical protein